jgi:hypothetical protein
MELNKTKCCSKCGVEKSLDSTYYHRDKKSKDGFKPICKVCQNENDRLRYDAKKNHFVPNVICNICSKSFYKKPSDILDVNFCGSECVNKHRKNIKFPERKTGVEKNCKCCNKQIYVIKSQIKENNFCSMECLYEYSKGKENVKLKNGKIINCDGCNSEIYRTPCSLGDKNFCSKECHDNSRKKRTLIKCDECNNNFEIRLSKKLYNKTFCGKECEINYRVKQQGKNDVINSDGIILRKCSICDITKELNNKFYNKHDGCKQGFRTECKECINNIKKERYQNDELYKMSVRVRSLVYDAFKSKGVSKIKKTEAILNCSIPEFMCHISKLFTDGMNWDNQGEWHIDHRIPISSAKTIDDLIKLNHFANLQPMWWEDNLRKSDNISEEWNNTMSIDKLIETTMNA